MSPLLHIIGYSKPEKALRTQSGENWEKMRSPGCILVLSLDFASYI